MSRPAAGNVTAGDSCTAPAVDSLTVVLPVYNEAGTIEQVIDDLISSLEALQQPFELLILNDGSTDWSPELERRLTLHGAVRLFSFSPNAGKGAMLNEAFRLVESELTVVIDADGEYAAGEVAAIVEPLLRDEADWVMGSRYGFGRPRPAQYRSTYLVNRLFNLWFYLLSGMRFHDLLTGLYAYRTRLVRPVRLREKRFSYTPELLWKVLGDRSVRVRELPISYRFRSYAEGKKIRWWETGTILLAMLRYRFRRARCKP